MLCRLSKFIVVRRLDDGGTWPAWVRAHLGRCDDCRAQHERECRVIERLSAGASPSRREAPPFLRARILAHLDSASGAASAPSRRLAPTWAWAGVIALAAGAWALTLHFHPPPAPSDNIANAAAPALPAEFAAMTNLPIRETVLALTAHLDEPLAAELRLVVDDARTALASLSRNFIPEDLLADWR